MPGIFAWTWIDFTQANRWPQSHRLADILEFQVARHLHDVKRWHEDHMISTARNTIILPLNMKLSQRVDLWVLDQSPDHFFQVVLHFGGWGCVVSTF